MKSRISLLGLAAAVALIFGASRASADMETLTLNSPNDTLSAFPGPYGTVTVDRTSGTTATITFSADQSPDGKYQYLFIDSGIAALSVNASTFTVGTVTESNSATPSDIAAFTPTWKDTTIAAGQNVDGHGAFNLVIDNVDSYKDSATSLVFTITDTSGTWASVSDVLVANSLGFEASAHILAANLASNGTVSNGTNNTGYTGNGTGVVPLPSSALLLGLGGLALIGFVGVRRFRKASAAA